MVQGKFENAMKGDNEMDKEKGKTIGVEDIYRDGEDRLVVQLRTEEKGKKSFWIIPASEIQEEVGAYLAREK